MTVCLDLEKLPEEPLTLARIRRCGCGDRVLVARTAYGLPVVLDAEPVIVGVKACPYCERRRNTKATKAKRAGVVPSVTICHECGNTGIRGEQLDSAVHVVMRITGIVRSSVCMVEAWDSAYRRHECATA